MKVIVVGVSLSGKTTALKHLRSQDNTLPIEEMDALLAQENRGVFPTDIQHKKELAARIVENLDRRMIAGESRERANFNEDLERY